MNTNAAEWHVLQAGDSGSGCCRCCSDLHWMKVVGGLVSEPGQVLPPHLVTAGWTLA